MATKSSTRCSKRGWKFKARWDDHNIETFLKLCIEEINAGNKLDTHFSSEGWKNLQQKFEEKTGCSYDKTQLKSKWDALKREFTSFAKLVEENHLQLDLKENTIQAPNEWWTNKSKEDPRILKWKNEGPKFFELQVKCFNRIIATRFAGLMSSLDPPSDEEDCRGAEIEDNHTTSIDEHEEDIEDNHTSSVDEDEDEEDSYEVGDIMQPTMMPSSSNINSKKRKIMGKGEKKVGVTEKLQRSLNRVIDGMDKMSHFVTAIREDDPCSYDKCLSMLDEVPGLIQGTYLYFLAARILANKENRIAFYHFMQNKREMTIGWLQTFSAKDIPRPR